MKFTYSSGQRPLEGYTLKRGIGRGGFGEVYYAVSDGGKEVALKLVNGNQEIELRGIAQCLNLKHANLVHLFDQRTDAEGNHWVVMEYVAGEPLSVVLNRHPKGLAPELARQWFLAMTQAIGYLHDHGIVHRDLKPGNIFVENGTVKVGDYGLSKFISSSQRTAQTQSVGTVYYMAPEISTGNYNKQIDIYAAGIILYEMLTGRVPFEGESAGEILMKHLTAPPDLTKLPVEFAPVVGKALAKDPAQRYASMQEMARALEGVNLGDKPAVATSRPVPASQPQRPAQNDAIPEVLPALSTRGQTAELSGSLALSAVLALLLATLWAALLRIDRLGDIGSLFFNTVAVCWCVLLPAKFWIRQAGDSLARRVVMMLLGVAVGAGALWVNGWTPQAPASPPAGASAPLAEIRQVGEARTVRVVAVGGLVASNRVEITDDGVQAESSTRTEHPFWSAIGTDSGMAVVAGYLSYFGLALAAVRWWKMTERRRSNRFSFFPVLAVGFWALVLLPLVWPWSETPYGALALVTAAVIVQWVSPWEAPAPAAPRRVRYRYA